MRGVLYSPLTLVNHKLSGGEFYASHRFTKVYSRAVKMALRVKMLTTKPVDLSPGPNMVGGENRVLNVVL